MAESTEKDRAREVAKTIIKAAVRELEKAQRTHLFNEMLNDLDTAENGDASAQSKEFHYCFVVAIFLLLIGAVFLTYWKGGNELLDASIDTKTLVAVLAFVVSLAAYLASVAREIVKRLGEPNLTVAERIKARRNVAWTTTAEIQLVLLGVFIIIRVAFGPGPFIGSDHDFLFNNFLAIYLGLILLFLAGLHARIWWKYPAFSIEKVKKRD